MASYSISDGQPMIVADGLAKHYGQATVVDALSFQVQPGRVTGFLGPNGAGKTQTIKMSLGARPTERAAGNDRRRAAGCA